MSNNVQIEDAKMTFFFERRDGTVVPVQENEAWSILSNRGRRYEHFKYLGASDGKKYRDAVLQAIGLQRQGKTIEGQELLRKALQEEIELAKGKLVQPRNMDKMGTGAHLI